MFIIFIVVSLLIEKMLSGVRTRITALGSKGMQHAFHGVMNELVLLGFLSFMLEILGPEVRLRARASPTASLPRTQLAAPMLIPMHIACADDSRCARGRPHADPCLPPQP